jgi:hypothetical protein
MALPAAPLRRVVRAAADTLAWLIHPSTHRFLYTAADAATARAAARAAAAAHAHAPGGGFAASPVPAAACPLRELGTATAAGALLRAHDANVDILSPSAARALAPAVAATLAAYDAASAWHVPRVACRLRFVREPSSVAHSGTLLAALAAAPTRLAARHVARLAAPLAEGIARAQRADGTFKARLTAHVVFLRCTFSESFSLCLDSLWLW